MKITYRGFEIEVERDASLAGYNMLYYSVYHLENGMCLFDSFEDSEDTVRDMVTILKTHVDNYLESPEDYISIEVKVKGESVN